MVRIRNILVELFKFKVKVESKIISIQFSFFLLNFSKKRKKLLKIFSLSKIFCFIDFSLIFQL